MIKKMGLIGNPNTGKTTLYNRLTLQNEKTGNWHGVTVEEKIGEYKFNDTSIQVVDLPGIYSIDTYTLEEKISLNFLNGKSDLILNIIEGCNFERNLNLTLQLKERGVDFILVINMADEMKKCGISIDTKKLSELLDVPVIAISSIKGKDDIKRLKSYIDKYIKLERAKKTKIIVKDRFQKISEIAKLVVTRDKIKFKFNIDNILLNKYLALPIFFFIMIGVFYLVFGRVGGMLTEGLNLWLNKSSNFIRLLLLERKVSPFFVGFITDGLIGGVCGVLSFMPRIILLYLCLGIMEDTGYMPRIAFMTDGFFKKIGLSGRAVFSLLMGFGCTAVAVTTTRGVESKSVQKKAIMLLPYISCSAKTPIYLLIISTFFQRGQELIMFGIYFVGVILAVVSLTIINKIYKNKEKFEKNQNFILEMPPYRIPSLKRVLKLLINYLKQFIIKIGKILCLLLTLLWILKSFTYRFEFIGASRVEESILCGIGKMLSFLFKPMGIDSWQVPLSALTGIIAKEGIAGTLLSLFPNGLETALSFSSAIAYLIFVMLYAPCISALSVMKNEIGIKATLYIALIQTATAFLGGYLTFFGLEIIKNYGFINTLLTLMIVFTVIILLMTARSIMSGKCCGKNCKNCGKCKGKINEKNNSKI